MQLEAWAALQELAHKRAVEPPAPPLLPAWEPCRRPHGPSAPAASRAPAAGSEEVLAAYEASLLHGRLSAAPRSSFLYLLAVHHLAASAFAPAGAPLLCRLLRSAPADACADLVAAASAESLAAPLRGGSPDGGGDGPIGPLEPPPWVAGVLQRAVGGDEATLHRLDEAAPAVAALARKGMAGGGVLV